MLMPASSEFVALCRAQIALLTQGLGASLSVVYLSQEVGAETQLTPIAAYPETAVEWHKEGIGALFPLATIAAVVDHSPRLLSASDYSSEAVLSNQESPQAEQPGARLNPLIPGQSAALVPQRQIVLPLLHEEVVFGLLVTARDDRAWSEWEQAQIQQIATTLALACILDQRSQWLEQDRQQQRLIQAQQRDLFDNLLHQFRNSLTALQTFGKLVLKRLLPGDANREIAASIVRETTRLKELSQQLELTTQWHPEELERPLPLLPASRAQYQPDAQLPPARLETQAVPTLPDGLLMGAALPLERCAVNTVLQPLLNAASAIAQDEQLTLSSSIPAVLPAVWANPPALREVLNNLLENALKYTPAGGQIEVQATLLAPLRAAEPPTWVEVSISDTGPGIPPQDLPHIFERRYRGVQAQSAIPGSGLGLAIARTLVQQMRGEIEVISPARGSSQVVGTTFVVRLAIAA
jgi:signal transduction histidine kinase